MMASAFNTLQQSSKKKTSSKNSIKINTLMIKHFAQLEIIVIILVTVEVLHIACVI